MLLLKPLHYPTYCSSTSSVDIIYSTSAGSPRGQALVCSLSLPLPLLCRLSAATGHVAIYPVAPQFGHIKRATNSSNWPPPTPFSLTIALLYSQYSSSSYLVIASECCWFLTASCHMSRGMENRERYGGSGSGLIEDPTKNK